MLTTSRAGYLGLALLGTLIGCTPTVDLDAEQAALRATDEAWAAAASAGTDVELVASFWADDATIYPNDAPVVQGRDEILEFVRASFALPGFKITWQPETVIVAAGGDIGTTTGANEFTLPAPDGGTMTIRGHYVTVWRKNADGEWKCIIDMFNSRAPMVPAEME